MPRAVIQETTYLGHPSKQTASLRANELNSGDSHWPDCSTCDWNTNGRAIAGVSEALAAPSSSAKSAKQSSSSKVKPLDGTSSTTEASTSALPSSTSIPRAFATLEKGSKKCYCKNSKAKRGIASKANKSTCIAPELGLPDSASK